MTLILDPADPIVAAWMRGEQPAEPIRCGARKPRLDPAEAARRLRASRRASQIRAAARKAAERRALAIAQGRIPGKPGRPTTGPDNPRKAYHREWARAKRAERRSMNEQINHEKAKEHGHA